MSALGSGADAIRVARLALLSAAAKAPGFLIPVIVAAFFGAGGYTDAYFLAYGAFLLAGGTVGPALESSVVPFAAAALTRGRASAEGLVAAFGADARRWSVLALGVGAAGLAIGLTVARPRGVASLDVALFYLLLGPAVLLWCRAGVFTGALAAAWDLEANAIGYAFRGLGALLGAVAGAATHTLWPVAAGVSLGEGGRVLWLRVRWRRAAARISEGVPGAAGSTGDIVRRGFRSASGHLVASQAIVNAAPLIERFVAGAIALAAISRVEYASRLVAVVAVIFDGAVGPWLLAHWSTARAQDRLRFDWHQAARPILLGSALALLAAMAMALGSGEIVHVALARGRFSAVDAEVVTRLLRWYAVAFFFTMTALCVERLVLAQSRSGLFLTLGGVRLAVRLGSLALLMPALGVFALPAALTIADALHVVLLLVGGRQPVAAPAVGAT